MSTFFILNINILKIVVDCRVRWIIIMNRSSKLLWGEKLNDDDGIFGELYLKESNISERTGSGFVLLIVLDNLVKNVEQKSQILKNCILKYAFIRLSKILT